jgi:hypothetical protein
MLFGDLFARIIKTMIVNVTEFGLEESRNPQIHLTLNLALHGATFAIISPTHSRSAEQKCFWREPTVYSTLETKCMLSVCVARENISFAQFQKITIHHGCDKIQRLYHPSFGHTGRRSKAMVHERGAAAQPKSGLLAARDQIHQFY